MITSCGIPSCVTCNEIKPEKYPRYIRTPEKRTNRKGKKERNRKEKKKRKYGKERKFETKTNLRSGRRPSPEETRLLFAGTISPMICPGDGPTEGRHDKTSRKARQEKKRRTQRHRAKNKKQKK